VANLHMTHDLLRAISRGERTLSDLVGVAMAHLFDLCPRCREALEAYRRELSAPVSPAPLASAPASISSSTSNTSKNAAPDGAEERNRSYQLAIERVRDRLRGFDGARRLDERVAADERQARRRLSELLELPAAERPERLRTAPERFAGPALASLLIDEARQATPGRPRDAEALASLARAVLQHGEHTGYTAELYARALAHGANALRVRGELCRADDLLGQARFMLQAQEGGDRPVRAELDSLEGSLRRDQRRLKDAERLFTRAATAWALEQDSVRAARELLNLGVVLREKGDAERSVEYLIDAADRLDPETEPRLSLYARHNLADSLNDAGRPFEARELVEETRPLWTHHSDPLTDLRRFWLEGKIARSLGEIAEAEHAFLAVRDSFLGQGIGYDAALVSLDLAQLYATEGRTADLKRLAEEIVPVFEAQDVHREAAAALMLFQDAVRAEQLTLHFLRDLAHYLHSARHDPRHPFHIPS